MPDEEDQTLGRSQSQIYDAAVFDESPDQESITSSRHSIASSRLNDREKDVDLDGHRPALEEIQTNASQASKRRVRRDSASANALDRTLSRRDTVLSRIRSRPNIQFTHPLAHIPTTEDQIVTFDGPDDPYHPLNWPTHKKVITTALYGFVTMTATWASSAYSAGTLLVAQEFHVGTQVATLGTTLFLFGFGVGPLLWAPLSEVYGRRIAVMAPMFVAICFSFATATAKDLQTIMLTRFFGAFFSSAPVTNTGGVLGDLFTPDMRGIAIAGYAMAVVGGPALGKHSDVLMSDMLVYDVWCFGCVMC